MRWLVPCLLLPTVLHASRSDDLKGLDRQVHVDDSLLPFEQFVRTGALPANIIDLIPGLQVTGLLADMERFNPIAQGETESVFLKLTSALRQLGLAKTAPLATALEPQKANFGTALLLGVLTPFAPDMLIVLKPAAVQFAKRPVHRQQQVLQAMRSVWAGLDSNLLESQDAELRPYVEALHLAAQSQLDALLAQKSTESLGPSHTAWEDSMVIKTVSLLEYDVGMAAQLLHHAAQLIDAAQREGTWKGRSYANGFNVQSALLESVCRRAGGPTIFSAIALAARLCSDPSQKSFLYPSPVDVTDLHEHFLLFRGMEDARRGVRAVFAEIKRRLAGAPSETLIFVFHAWAEKLPRWHQAIVLDEARSNGDSKAGIGRELIVGFTLRHKDVHALNRLRELVANAKLNALLRAQFSALLCEVTGDQPEADDLRHCMIASIHLLDKELPSSGAVWEKLLPAFNRSPKTAMWNDLAKVFRQSWLHRARFQKLGNLPAWQRFNLTQATALHALETFARSAYEPDLVAFADHYRIAYRSLTSARLILARHRCAGELQEVMAFTNGIAGTQDDTSGVSFRKDDAAIFDWLNETLPDASKCALARAQVAQVRDSRWQPPAVSRDQRLRQEAEQWLLREADVLSPTIRKHVEDILLESLSAAQLLAPSLLKTKAIEQEWRSALPANGGAFQRVRMIRRPLALAIAALAKGDDQPWQQSLVWLKHHLLGSQEAAGLRKDLSYCTAAICVSSLRQRGIKDQWVLRVLNDVIALKPESAPISEVEEVFQTRLGYHVIRGDLQSEVTNVPGPLWLVYVLNVAALDNQNSGLHLLLNALRDPLASNVLRQADDLSYHGKMPAHWSDALLREHTLTLMLEHPGNSAVLLSILNAWAGIKDTRPLLDAVRVVRPLLEPSRNAKAISYIASAEREAVLLHPQK